MHPLIHGDRGSVAHRNQFWYRDLAMAAKDETTNESDERNTTTSNTYSTPRFRNSRHIRVVAGRLRGIQSTPQLSAAALVDDCVRRLSEGAKRFPPKLFVLWLTPAFQPYEKLVPELRAALDAAGFSDVPLIGASVAVCLFDGDAHEEGAVLLAFASSLMQVTVGIGENAQKSPGEAVRSLCSQLNLTGAATNSRGTNQCLICFLPGHDEDARPESFAAYRVERRLRRETGSSLHMFGGVASGGLTQGPGSQFLNGRVYRGAVVGARVDSNVTYGIGINHGVCPTGEFLHLEEVSRDGQTVESLRGISIEEAVRQIGSPAVLQCESAKTGERILVGHKLVDGVAEQRRLLIGKFVVLEPVFRLAIDAHSRRLPDLRYLRRSAVEATDAIESKYRSSLPPASGE